MAPPFYPDIVQFLAGNLFSRSPLPTADLSGKTIVVTGANTGLGLDASKHLARLGVSTLVLACRSTTKGETARDSIYEETKCKGKTSIEVWEVDLSSYNSVTAFAERVRSDLKRLDGFIANAGVELVDFELSEGLERTLTVNNVSTFLLNLSVMPKLQETARTFDTDTTLTVVGSCIHIMAPDGHLDAAASEGDVFAALSNAATADMQERYPLSKLVGHHLFNGLAARVDAREAGQRRGVLLNLVNPGWCVSELDRNKPPLSGMDKVMAALFRRSRESGSRTLVHAVCAGRDTTGLYLSECKVKPQSTYVRSERGQEMQTRIWRDFISRLEGIPSSAVDVSSWA